MDEVTSNQASGDPKEKNLSTKRYEKELENLQIELVKLQDWIQHQGLKVVVIFDTGIMMNTG